MLILLVNTVGLLGYSNGANDNFKGMASRFYSRTCDYRTATSWATVATFAGSVTSWVFTLPCAALFSAIAFRLVQSL